MKKIKIPSSQSSALKVGSIIEILDHASQKWVERKITKATNVFVWFPNSGYARIKRTTFDNYPQFYRIKTV